MEKREIYLDNSATTRVFPEVVRLMDTIYLDEYGNPSSMHHKGVEAERHIRGGLATKEKYEHEHQLQACSRENL